MLSPRCNSTGRREIEQALGKGHRRRILKVRRNAPRSLSAHALLAPKTASSIRSKVAAPSTSSSPIERAYIGGATVPRSRRTNLIISFSVVMITEASARLATAEMASRSTEE